MEKKARKPSGLILSKKPYVTNEAEVVRVRIDTTIHRVLNNKLKL